MKKTSLSGFALAFCILIWACAEKGTTENPSPETESKVEVQSQTQEAAVGTVVQVVRIKSSLSEEELMTKAKERAKQFRELPGLVQKYYVKLNDEGEYSGIYIWDSKESLMAFKESELAATIGEAYKLTEPPAVEVSNILFQLRE